ncbi:MAG: bacteriohemerythrin [gamma proteobacterium symbiont of Bathyaustriella thionipta]|nr:bacteriohemerythrin [gamma proteobacterium symbiont of Bathyaustriella thionipta]MCU7949978.1 bacteriohemerythrin [gamma proteobacterium symbiont of Bathyaustriella thionipta]MCU7954772.1 bacteriohemerythrin [gamma proteobacterium symbiont of Bathyaustriella thionipta]MCU7956556.1 bacteriohemerythrin [gamma proteobacterium symbiont of Bathyaustriella thionipta]MCU7966551.1 bacteriohemerythrin [gamma proteobacterium symbiont of Bathyaustriella thionipta]
MPLIQWNNELSVGINSIDEQHKKLVNLINELNDALQSGKANQVLAGIFDGLAVYTINHFGYEEELFAQYGYPESQAHKNEHRVLIQQVNDLQEKMNQGDFMISVEVMVFLKNWLINHILKTDKAYAQFLKDKGVL